MKKLMFAVIACAMGLSGCSSEDDCATNPEPAGDVTEIKLSAGIQGVATRTPVSTNDNITGSVCGLRHHRRLYDECMEFHRDVCGIAHTDSRTLFQPGTVLSGG